LAASEVAALLAGMKVATLATVTAHGAPRVSAVDGHFVHGTWAWSTSGSSAKARHLAARPAVSIAHVDNEDLAASWMVGYAADREQLLVRRELSPEIS
jgi:general stress protein 26